MSTELEKYLKKNRKSLDVEIPDDASIWEGYKRTGWREEPAEAGRAESLYFFG
jgi:hypothetical protein